MGKLAVGDTFPAMAQMEEGTFFEITESGPMWIINYRSPTEQEIAAVAEGSAFEIRSMVKNDVLWVFTRCGDQEWLEAPYNPHLSKAPLLSPIADGESGYGLTLVLLDMNSNKIISLRLIGLGNSFSKQLYASVEELKKKPFNPQAYDATIRRTQIAYSTQQLVRQCRNYWKLR